MHVGLDEAAGLLEPDGAAPLDGAARNGLGRPRELELGARAARDDPPVDGLHRHVRAGVPRTLGQILHADLEVSDLHAAPIGRRTIRTTIRGADELLHRADGKGGVIPFIAGEAARGRRTFVIVPLVQDDESATATSVDVAAEMLRSAWHEATTLAEVAGTPPAIEIVHGQMKASERDERMERFRAGQTSILVGTTVLEVGVDVPEATVMLILDADRFGVARAAPVARARGPWRGPGVLASWSRPSIRPALACRAGRTKQRGRGTAGRRHRGHPTASCWPSSTLQLRREGQLAWPSAAAFRRRASPRCRRRATVSFSVEARSQAERLVDPDGPAARGPARVGGRADGWLAEARRAGDVLSADELDA